ncbi:MAG: alpha/beta hydrolase [Hyphomonadaceae bacterium]
MPSDASSTDPTPDAEFISVDGRNLALRRFQGDPGRAGLVWLGGFHSDMLGEKATSLHAAARDAGRSFLRFDYSGHGESEGDFADGVIGQWRADALAMIDNRTEGPQVLVGSSMGGWMALLAALARPDRVKAVVLLAPAPDFTDRLMWRNFPDEVKTQILETGSWTRPSPYDEAGYPITRALIEEGRNWNILDKPIALSCPVAILHGANDADVPWSHGFGLVDAIASDDVTFTLVKAGDHRLSRPQDIALMIRTALALADQVDAG